MEVILLKYQIQSQLITILQQRNKQEPRQISTNILKIFIFLGLTILLGQELPLQKMEKSQIDSMLKVNALKELNIAERIDYYSSLFLGTEYSWTPTGDGTHSMYETEPLFNFQLTNCMVLCEHALAMAISDSWDNFFNNLQQLRYKDGIIGMKTRNHYTIADWVPENSWIIEDITVKIGGKYTQKTTRHIAYSKFFSEKKLTDLRYIKQDQGHTIDYIKWQDIPKIKHNIKQGDILAMILKGKDNIFSGHMILVVEVDDRLFIREASTSKMTTFETEFDKWASSDYARKKYCGIIVTRVMENLNQPNKVILPWEIQSMK